MILDWKAFFVFCKNQYDTDLLHSFVLSEFSKKTDFPLEFHSFLGDDWDSLIARIKEIELGIISQLNPFFGAGSADQLKGIQNASFLPAFNSF